MAHSLNGMAIKNDSASGSWTDIQPGGFDTLTDNSIIAADRFASLAVKNTHASQTLYILLRADDLQNTLIGDAIAVGPLAAVTIDCSQANAGNPPSSISVRGSAAGTTYEIIATLARKF